MPRIKGIDKSGHAIGSFIDIAYDSALPPGTLLCDGTAISRYTYAALFAVLQETWGPGDGSTTFNLPDHRGYFRRSRDHGTGRDPNASIRTPSATGAQSGDLVGSLQTDQMQGHYHNTNTGPNMVSSPGASGNAASSGGGTQWQGSAMIVGPTTDGVNGAPRTGSETRPVNVYANTVVAYI